MNRTRIVDMHCDTISEIYYSHKSGNPQNLRKNNLHIDIEKMKQSGYMMQNFAMFTELNKVADPFDHVIKLIDTFYQEIEKNKNDISVILKYNDIMENEEAGLMSAMMTIEEGACCKGNLEYLRTLYRLGARMMTLTWNFANELGYPNIPSEDESAFDGTCGLTDTGIDFLREMERLGIIIDVSHLSDAGFFDVAKYTSKPFVASHSNARSLCSHRRNLTDEMIKIIGERGGVIGLNYYGMFLEDGQRYDNCIARLDALVKHAKYITNLGGMNCLGLGSDFDGITGTLEFKDASRIGMIEDSFLKAGFTSNEIEKIFNKNVLAVYKDLLK